MKTVKSMHSQAGLTLVELMIGLTLGSFLLWGAVSVISSGRIAYNSAQRFTGLQSDLSYINDAMLVDSRSASAIQVTNNSQVLTITSGANTIVYQRTTNGELTRTINTEAAAIIAENVNVFTVQCLDALSAVVACASAIQLNITAELETTTNSQTLQHRISFRSALRNSVLQSKFNVAAGG